MEQETITKAESVREGRIQKLTELVEMGINPYPYTFDKNANAQELQTKYEALEAGSETEDEYAIAGRIMSMRNTGMFIDLMDSTGKIQIFSHKENLSEEQMQPLPDDESVGVIVREQQNNARQFAHGILLQTGLRRDWKGRLL